MGSKATQGYFELGLGLACCSGIVTRRAEGHRISGSGEGKGADSKRQSAPAACSLHCSIINFCGMLPAFIFFFHSNLVVLLSCLVLISDFLYQFYSEQK